MMSIISSIVMTFNISDIESLPASLIAEHVNSNFPVVIGVNSMSNWPPLGDCRKSCCKNVLFELDRVTLELTPTTVQGYSKNCPTMEVTTCCGNETVGAKKKFIKIFHTTTTQLIIRLRSIGIGVGGVVVGVVGVTLARINSLQKGNLG